MKKGNVQNHKQRLLAEKEEFTRQLREFDRQLDASERDSISELSLYDNHPGDIGTEVFERSKDFALREDVKNKIVRIEEALGRIEQGTYGRCKDCKREISPARLDALPDTDLCDVCKDLDAETEAEMPHSNNRVSTTWESESSSQERGTARRPVEEDVLAPPFARVNNDGTDKTYYDGEDAWQDVARFSEHAEGSGAGAYYGPSEMGQEDRGFVEGVDDLPYYKGINGVVYRDYKNIANDEEDIR